MTTPDTTAAAEHGLLEIRGLRKRFGGVTAVNALDMTVRAGDVHALIGPNGSGKTTTLNVISGLYQSDGGSVAFDEHELAGRQAHAIAALGIGRTFQNIRLFGALSVLENAACPTAISGGSRSLARWRRSRACCSSTSRPPG